MKTLMHAAACGIVLTLAAGCTTTLDRAKETALNRALGIDVTPNQDGIEVRLPESALFDFDQSALNPGSVAVMDRSAVLLKRSTKPIYIEGYTDNVGPTGYNKQLSEARAVSVGEALVARGIDEDRISIRGNAAGNPVASNATRQGRALNRRTEIFVRGETLETLVGKP